MPNPLSFAEQIHNIEHQDRRNKNRKGILGHIQKIKDAVTGDSPSMKRLKETNESIFMTAEEAAGLANEKGSEHG